MKHCIFHIPHSSRHIPDKYRDQFTINDNALTIELDKLNYSLISVLNTFNLSLQIINKLIN